MGTPTIAIFVRHSAQCRYRDDETWKRCNCRKHLRWTQNGVQHRRKAGTRSWVEAEEAKRRLEDKLAGRTPQGPQEGVLLADAIKLFDAEKRAQGIVEPMRRHYERDLNWFREFSESRDVLTVREALALENLIAFRATWPKRLRSTVTQRITQGRLGVFLKFALNARWIDRETVLTPVKMKAPDTEPLTAAEYENVLKHAEGKTRVLIELMRWSGLAIRDAALLKRSDLVVTDGTYRIIRKRTKTGNDMYIPLKPEVGSQVVGVLNGNPEYVFWDRKKSDSSEYYAAASWGQKVASVFKAAGIISSGHMISHRLRDTYAVDLLQKGVPLEHVSKLLGHKSVVTTEKHYAKWSKGRQELLDNLVSATWKK
jgi:integrase/recombinase XerD